jgi:riboflavin transporter FmnP
MAFKARVDSKSIAILSVFSAMAVLLEVFPIIGITDLKLVPEVPSFTIDWTGIPIFLIFLGFGIIGAFFSITLVGIAIGYRNPVGALFKILAEGLTIIGALIGWFICRKLKITGYKRIMIYLIPAIFLRVMGMYYGNIFLLQFFYSIPYEAAVISSTILIPWNAIQASINIFVGGLLFYLIPDNLKMEAGFTGDEEIDIVHELTDDEIELESSEKY